MSILMRAMKAVICSTKSKNRAAVEYRANVLTAGMSDREPKMRG